MALQWRDGQFNGGCVSQRSREMIQDSSPRTGIPSQWPGRMLHVDIFYWKFCFFQLASCCVHADRLGEHRQPLQENQTSRGEAVRRQAFVVKTQGGWKAGTCHLQRSFISENKKKKICRSGLFFFSFEERLWLLSMTVSLIDLKDMMVAACFLTSWVWVRLLDWDVVTAPTKTATK